MGHFITTVIGTATGMIIASGVIMVMAFMMTFNPRIIKWVTKRTIKLVEEVETDLMEEVETDL